MKIAISSDHAGFPLKEAIRKDLGGRRPEISIADLGAYDETPSDYPDAAERLAEAIREGKVERGILICGSGVGASVAANKVPGIRAGLCHDHYSAHQGVEHDDMNILVLGSRVIGVAPAFELVDAFLDASFTNEERHLRRLGKVKAIEKKNISAA